MFAPEDYSFLLGPGQFSGATLVLGEGIVHGLMNLAPQEGNNMSFEQFLLGDINGIILPGYVGIIINPYKYYKGPY